MFYNQKLTIFRSISSKIIRKSLYYEGIKRNIDNKCHLCIFLLFVKENLAINYLSEII
jgi:hypothetical protein